MPSYSGVWNLVSQLQAIGQNQWLQNPGAPTIGTATAGDASASVTFSAPAFDGNTPITGYRATSSPGSLTATGASSPLTVTGLTNGTPYTFTVAATNAIGYGPESAASNSATPSLPNRAVFAGGSTGASYTATMDYVNIATTGNATSFGSLYTGALGFMAPGASSTRGVLSGGAGNSSNTNVIQFISFTPGGSSDFGDLSQVKYAASGASNSTRSLIFGGYVTGSVRNVIEYITIASTGNAANFGDMFTARAEAASCGSSTRAVTGGGSVSGGRTQNIEYSTIATLGNGITFGNLSYLVYQLAACSSSTRALFGGGYNNTAFRNENRVFFVTIATTGDATYFGDLTAARVGLTATSSATRGIFAGGNSNNNIIDYVTIASTGNAIDFGDLTAGREYLAAVSNCHGGL
jgi:hypothetical protein